MGIKAEFEAYRSIVQEECMGFKETLRNSTPFFKAVYKPFPPRFFAEFTAPILYVIERFRMGESAEEIIKHSEEEIRIYKKEQAS